MKMIKVILMLLTLAGLSACISPKSYVDPQYKESSYDEIKKVAKEHAIKIEVEFQRNGEHLAKVDQQLKTNVENILRKTGVVLPDENSPVTIKVTVNNIADIGNGVKKGIGTGLTLGAVGTVVKDSYEINIDMQQEHGKSVHKSYKHAIYTTVGHKAAPINVESMKPSDAFAKVVEDILLNFIKDMQKQKLLSFNNLINTLSS